MVGQVTHVFSLANRPGPTHACQPGTDWDLSMCGVRLQFRHEWREGSAEEVTCRKCLRQLRVGVGRANRS